MRRVIFVTVVVLSSIFLWFPTFAYSLPETVDLSAYVPKILDQAGKPACASYAFAQALNIELARLGLLSDVGEIDPEYIYEGAGQFLATSNHHDLLGTKVTRTIIGRDDASLVLYPGRDRLYLLKLRIRQLKNLDDVRQALARKHPVFLGVSIQPGYPTFYLGEKQGIVLNVTGLHAVLAVGYTPWGIKILNSWGEDWGNGGYAMIPNDTYLRVVGLACEIRLEDVYAVHEGECIAAAFYPVQGGVAFLRATKSGFVVEGWPQKIELFDGRIYLPRPLIERILGVALPKKGDQDLVQLRGFFEARGWKVEWTNKVTELDEWISKSNVQFLSVAPYDLLGYEPYKAVVSRYY